MMMKMMKLKRKCMLMKSLKSLRPKIILKDQDLWNYRGKKDQGKIPAQNVTEENSERVDS